MHNYSSMIKYVNKNMLHRVINRSRSRHITPFYPTTARFHTRVPVRSKAVGTNDQKDDDLLIEDTYALLRNDYRNVMDLQTTIIH